MSLLEIQNLQFSFPRCPPLLKGINLQLQEGCFALVAGRNGTGKTQLMYHLNGLNPIQKGEILFRGQPIKKVKNLRQKVGLVFQNADNQFVSQSVFREIAFGPSNIGLKRDEILKRTEEMLELFHLQDFRNRNPHSLSGGEKRRLAMASLLVMDPELLVLDEPFTGLDLPGVEQVLGSLLELQKRGHGLLLITHDVEKCLAHSSSVHILDNGIIAAQGKAEEILPQLNQWDIYNPWQENRPLKSYTWLREKQ